MASQVETTLGAEPTTTSEFECLGCFQFSWETFVVNIQIVQIRRTVTGTTCPDSWLCSTDQCCGPAGARPEKKKLLQVVSEQVKRSHFFWLWNVNRFDLRQLSAFEDLALEIIVCYLRFLIWGNVFYWHFIVVCVVYVSHIRHYKIWYNMID